MLNLFKDLFKDPNDIYLTKPMKKKKRKLTRTTFAFYITYSILFLTQIFIMLSYKFSLFKPAEEGLKLSGWILLITILLIYFLGKKGMAKLKKLSEGSKSVWVDQLYVIIPLLISVLLVTFINYRIAEVLYVLGHILIARILWSPVNVLYLRSSRKLEIFNKNIEKYTEKESASDFEKEFMNK